MLWVVGLVTALLTAVYMARGYLLDVRGRRRAGRTPMDTHPHESPWTMTVPLVVLAALAAVGGFFGLPPWSASSRAGSTAGSSATASHAGPVADSLDPLWAAVSPYELEHHVAPGLEWLAPRPRRRPWP